MSDHKHLPASGVLEGGLQGFPSEELPPEGFLPPVKVLGPTEIQTTPLADLVSEAEIIPPPQDLTEMNETKPLKDSRTAQSSILVVLLAVWSPLMLTLDAVLGFFGVPLDAAAWAAFSDDDVISRGELLAIMRDVIMAGLALAAIYFRKAATSTIKGVFTRN